MLEQEDGENWAQSTMQTTDMRVRTVPQLLKMDGPRQDQHDDGLRWIEPARTNTASSGPMPPEAMDARLGLE